MKKFPDKADSHAPAISIKKESSLIPDMPCKEVRVRVGKMMHPMEEAHHIRFIDFYIDDKYVDRASTSIHLYPASTFYLKTMGVLKSGWSSCAICMDTGKPKLKWNKLNPLNCRGGSRTALRVFPIEMYPQTLTLFSGKIRHKIADRSVDRPGAAAAGVRVICIVLENSSNPHALFFRTDPDNDF